MTDSELVDFSSPRIGAKVAALTRVVATLHNANTSADTSPVRRASATVRFASINA